MSHAQRYDSEVPRAVHAERPGAGPLRRLLFAGIGLTAGDVALLIVLLYNSMPEWGVFLPYAVLSLFGWILIGFPVALACPGQVG